LNAHEALKACLALSTTVTSSANTHPQEARVLASRVPPIPPLEGSELLALDNAKRVVMEFRSIIPAGETRAFYMGARGQGDDEEPRHQVQLSEFYLGRFPVTQREFSQWLATHSNGCKGEGYDNHPAESMTWYQAMQFCRWLNQEVLPTAAEPLNGMLAILPTEAQWEYACRGGSNTDYYNGDGEAALAQVGWYYNNSGTTTHAVGGMPDQNGQAHAFGLSDMHGNVWEWCLDVWDDKAYRSRPAMVSNPLVMNSDDQDLQEYLGAERLRSYWPQRSGDSAYRVVRGGSWNNYARGCRSAYRSRGGPDSDNRYLGFRVCLVPDPAKPVPQPDKHQPDSQGAEGGAEPQSGAGRLEGGRAQDSGSVSPSAQPLSGLRFPKRLS
jgi:formylglycine-generating enzyme required for sulfatase activity